MQNHALSQTKTLSVKLSGKAYLFCLSYCIVLNLGLRCRNL